MRGHVKIFNELGEVVHDNYRKITPVKGGHVAKVDRHIYPVKLIYRNGEIEWHGERVNGIPAQKKVGVNIAITPDEKVKLKKIAQKNGYSNVSGFFQGIASGYVENIKGLTDG